MKKILVTGGAGFIGSHLVDALVGEKAKVTIFDNLDRQVHGGRLPAWLNLGATFIRGDVRDRAAFRDVVRDADVIYHLAAVVGVGQSQYEIARYVESNIQGTANLLDILANGKHRVKKLVIASSMSIYGEGLYRCGKCGGVKPALREFTAKKIISWEPRCPHCRGTLKPVPTSEETPLCANSVYAVTKKEQEELCLMIGKVYGIPTVAFRFFNVYGPRQSLSNPYTGVGAIFLSRLKNDNRPVIYEDGNQTRDFIWVGDVARGLIAAMKSDKADYRILNLGTGKPVAIADIARTLARLLGKRIEPDITGKFRKGDVRHCFADMTKTKKLLGFTPKTGFEEGMKLLIAWGKKAKAVDKFETAERELRSKGLVS